MAYVINFSVYEGPTSLDALLNNSENQRLFNNLGVPSDGDLSNIDPYAQAAECRFSKLMRAISDGRIEGRINAASDLFARVNA